MGPHLCRDGNRAAGEHALITVSIADISNIRRLLRIPPDQRKPRAADRPGAIPPAVNRAILDFAMMSPIFAAFVISHETPPRAVLQLSYAEQNGNQRQSQRGNDHLQGENAGAGEHLLPSALPEYRHPTRSARRRK